MNTSTSKQSAVVLGPSGVAVAENVKRLRTAQRRSLRDLEAGLRVNGYPISYSALSKIENQTRRVDVDDLMALAVVLGVSPVALLIPHADNPRGLVDITGWGSEPAMIAWLWATAAKPLAESPSEEFDPSVDPSKPWWLRAETRYVLDGIHPDAEDAEIRRRLRGDDGVDQTAP